MADEEYKRQAQLVYDHMKTMHEFSLKMQSEYGRWLISTLITLHTAAIAGLFYKTLDNHPPYLSSIWWFVVGIILGLATGFLAWWNFSFAANSYHNAADHRMLNDPTYWPSTMTNQKAVTLTLWATQVCGVASALCLAGGILWAYKSIS